MIIFWLFGLTKNCEEDCSYLIDSLFITKFHIRNASLITKFHIRNASLLFKVLSEAKLDRCLD